STFACGLPGVAMELWLEADTLARSSRGGEPSLHKPGGVVQTPPRPPFHQCIIKAVGFFAVEKPITPSKTMKSFSGRPRKPSRLVGLMMYRRNTDVGGVWPVSGILLPERRATS